ncbi:hypothetical protein SAMN04488057_10591 [Cyclobacterium lianum]|uniref:Lipoprotein SmpA/OmlA domain-containing protein n=1 Tax=Cyclobacterium lianum TaxID=388280 RepID=A0A1M7N6S0_9BACT|nr:hypothetical protein [Cyclobacterium lianum]SHM99129.1 hypothetical protein SAMN04488057_10591 [Cyclobacterium lianum]
MIKSQLFFALLFLMVLSSCSPHLFASLRSNNMSQLELGMSREQVTGILGDNYTIAEKRIEEGVPLEVLSYRNFPNNDEFYLFVFKNNELEEWYRELVPNFESRKD